ncbi:MAG: elongation factor Ts, partial [Patescibacteria group bacterium]
GLVDSYVHAGKIGVVLTLLCETDFVARTAEFKNLSHEIAMHIAAMNPKDVDVLLKQEYVRDPKMTVQDLIKQSIGKLGENIVVREFNRVEL